MAKHLLLEHYRGTPASVNDIQMDQWTPDELAAHVQYMEDFAARLDATGEFVDSDRRLDGDRRRDIRAGVGAGR